MSGNELLKVIDKSQVDIDTAITNIQTSNLPEDTKDFAISCIKLAVWFPKALLEKKIKLSNLRKLVFGRGKNTNKKLRNDNTMPVKEPEREHTINDTDVATAEHANSIVPATANSNKLPGHGRLPHSAYSNTTEHMLTISDLKAGDLCPEFCGGKLYRYEPGVLVRVKGQNLAAVYKYWIEKLRCGSCGYLVQAEVPHNVGKEKYDAAFKAVLVLQKYYMAIPFHRQAYFQSLLEMPLPVSTQWQLIEEVFGIAIYVFKILEDHAANGRIIHNDDTYLKITSLIHLGVCQRSCRLNNLSYY
jgi:transposase